MTVKLVETFADFPFVKRHHANLNLETVQRLQVRFINALRAKKTKIKNKLDADVGKDKQ